MTSATREMTGDRPRPASLRPDRGSYPWNPKSGRTSAGTRPRPPSRRLAVDRGSTREEKARVSIKTETRDRGPPRRLPRGRDPDPRARRGPRPRRALVVRAPDAREGPSRSGSGRIRRVRRRSCTSCSVSVPANPRARGSAIVRPPRSVGPEFVRRRRQGPRRRDTRAPAEPRGKRIATRRPLDRDGRGPRVLEGARRRGS